MVTLSYWRAFATAASITRAIGCNTCQKKFWYLHMRRWQRLKYVHLRLVTFDWQVLKDNFQQSANKRIFCVFWGIISEDRSRFVLLTGGTKKGHIWMQMIAETVGEFLNGELRSKPAYNRREYRRTLLYVAAGITNQFIGKTWDDPIRPFNQNAPWRYTDIIHQNENIYLTAFWKRFSFYPGLDWKGQLGVIPSMV